MNKPEVLALMDNPCQQFSIVKAYCLCVSVINCRNYATAQQQCDNIVVEPQKKKQQPWLRITVSRPVA